MNTGSRIRLPRPKKSPKPRAAATETTPAANPGTRRPKRKADADPNASVVMRAPKKIAPKGSAAKSADVPAASDASDEEEDDRPVALPWWRSIVSLPTAISILLHAIVMIGLALYILPGVATDLGLNTIVSSNEPTDQPALETVEITEFEVTEVAPPSAAAMIVQTPVVTPDGPQASLSERSLADNAFGGPTMNYGDGLDLNAAISEGASGVASFFGIESKGSNFIYVIDNSKSMNGGKFEAACEEMLRSVDSLGPKQGFYVLFFSDKAYPLFFPQTATNIVKATPDNKEKLKAWVGTVPLILKTNAQEAVMRALYLHPDSIYILTDGAFGDKTTEMLLAMHENRIPIHTVAFGNKSGEKDLMAISKKHAGTYRYVEVKKAAKKNDKPKADPRKPDDKPKAATKPDEKQPDPKTTPGDAKKKATPKAADSKKKKAAAKTKK